MSYRYVEMTFEEWLVRGWELLSLPAVFESSTVMQINDDRDNHLGSTLSTQKPSGMQDEIYHFL